MRHNNRPPNQLRPVRIVPHYLPHTHGSAFIEMGNTHLICTATVEENVPPFLKGQNQGWITAEYGMLPASTASRMRREAAAGKQSGRTQEIQRLIGRALRAAVDLSALGERQITIDCDVIRADGGTRTAAITGGFVALSLAINGLIQSGKLERNPIHSHIAAVSAGIVGGQALLDLDYIEDSGCDSDVNIVMTESGKIIEIQGTAEGHFFSRDELNALLDLAQNGITQLCQAQKTAMTTGHQAT